MDILTRRGVIEPANCRRLAHFNSLGRYHWKMDRFSGGPCRAVVLFDIDGTLIRRAGPHHRQALVDAIRDVTGVDTAIDHIPTHGMLDRDIIKRMLQDAGFPPADIHARMTSIVGRAQEVYQELCPDLTGSTCPGTIELLQSLQRERIPAGLVTGNLSAIAWKKMEAAGLRPYFRFGAFAEMAETRADLARIAVEHASEQGWVGPKTTVSLIGDHPNDVDAARRNGLRAVAVGTGVTAPAELRATRPDKFFDDLSMLRVDDLL